MEIISIRSTAWIKRGCFGGKGVHGDGVFGVFGESGDWGCISLTDIVSVTLHSEDLQLHELSWRLNSSFLNISSISLLGNSS
jgi:hypothetical protein